MRIPRQGHASVVLPGGDVLVTGGWSIYRESPTDSCEIYDVSTGKWRYTSNMNSGRANHKLVLLHTGEVLAIGGYKNRSCEIFDPETEQWRWTDSLNTERNSFFTATLLSDGRVLVTGGFVGLSYPYEKSAEIYDPWLERWQFVDSMRYGRKGHTATLLMDGRVLVVGGSSVKRCELFDPNTGQWQLAAELDSSRERHSDILLPDGRVLVMGGRDRERRKWLSSCELYDPENNSWQRVGDMFEGRISHYSLLLPNGRILVAGGSVNITWELYDPENFQPVYLGSYPVVKEIPTMNLLPDGRILSIGGRSWTDTTGIPLVFPTEMCEIYDPDLTGIIHDSPNLSARFQLFQNYPNPFNGETIIRYYVPLSSHVSLKIYDLLGREVDVLVDERHLPGFYQVRVSSFLLPSGTYFYVLRVNDQTTIRKMVVLK
ncbi:MAG: T9SS type A sorting domain-containing protein [Calditrichaeota bacterium]|nr:T9SS type A sorting domain-containing protein [Calditrichota bacterium]